MKRTKIILIISALFMLQSCSYNLYKKQSSQSMNELKYIAQTPDSLLTNVQRRTKNSLLNLIKIHVKVKDNHFVNNATPKDFKKEGLSIEYFYLLDKDIKEVNSYIDLIGIKNLDELYSKGEIEF